MTLPTNLTSMPSDIERRRWMRIFLARHGPIRTQVESDVGTSVIPYGGSSPAPAVVHESVHGWLKDNHAAYPGVSELPTEITAGDPGYLDALNTLHAWSNDEVEPPPTGDVVRLGLFATEAELAVWRDRWTNGPYKSTGDSSQFAEIITDSNSPGDVDRINTWANSWSSNPPSVWNPNVGSLAWNPYGHSSINNGTAAGSEPPRNNVADWGIRAAAFKAMIDENVSLADQVVDWLEDQADEPQADFSDTDIWLRHPNSHHSVVFRVPQYLGILIQAYDFARIAGGGTSPQHAKVDQWFLDAQDWHWPIVFHSTAGLWNDRWALDPNPSNPGTLELTHTVGHEAATHNKSYNNRRSTSVIYAALAGVMFGQTTEVEWAKQWVKEWLHNGIYHDHDIAEMHRSRDGGGVTSGAGSERGWHYSSLTAQDVLLTAEVLARDGDMELYDFSTDGGVHGSGSTGIDKSLLFAAQAYVRYANDTHERYGNDDTVNTHGDIHHRIDGRRNRNASNWAGNREVQFAAGNKFWDDAEIKAAYMHDTAADYPPYWSNAQLNAHNVDYGGRIGLPGTLLMYGALEHIDAYPEV